MPAITIPISTIMDVLNAHERQQNALDIGRGKKRDAQDRDDDDSYLKHLVLRLKRQKSHVATN